MVSKAPQAAAPAAVNPNRKKIMMGVAIGLPLLTVMMLAMIIANRPAPRLAGANPAASVAAPSAAKATGSPSAEIPQKPSAGTPTNSQPPAGKSSAAKAATRSATPAPKASTGEARITSTPSGAKVVIGGVTQPNWITPFTAPQLDPGTYEVTLSKPGYVSQTRNLVVAAGKTENLSAELVIAGAKVNVASTPPGGAILVDGKPTGKFTPATIAVQKGERTIEIRKDGFRVSSNTLVVKDGDAPSIAPVLEAERAASPTRVNPLRALFGGRIPEGKGMVNIKTNPAGAQIIHEGNVSPKLSPLRWPMEPGIYRVTIRKEGFRPTVREFTVEKGKVTELDIPLVPR